MYTPVIAGMAGSILALLGAMFIAGRFWEEIDDSPGLTIYVMFATLISMGLGYFIPHANLSNLPESRETLDLFIVFAIALHVSVPVWWLARFAFNLGKR